MFVKKRYIFFGGFLNLTKNLLTFKGLFDIYLDGAGLSLPTARKNPSISLRR
jgi:hypothetical protein